MSRSILLYPLALLAFTATISIGTAQPAKRVDRYADVLPDGAITRIGSTRFRHDAPLGRIHYSGDGKTLIGEGASWNSYNKATRIWDVDTGKQLPQFRGKLLGDDLALSPDGKFFVDRRDGAARLWDIAVGKVVRTWGGDSSPKKKEDFSVAWPSFSYDGKILILPGMQGDKDLIRRFDLKTGTELRRHEMPEESFGPCGHVSPDGRCLLVDMEAKKDERSFFLVNLDTGKTLHAFENSAPENSWWGKDFSPDGKTLIAVADERELLIWDASTGKRVRRLENGKTGFRLRGPAFSPDGKHFTVNDGNDANVMIYEAATGKLLHTLSNGGMLNRCVFSADGKLLLAPSITEISVWEVVSGKKVCGFDFKCGPDSAEAAVAFSPDGKRIAFSDDRLLRVGDIATGKLLFAEEGSHLLPSAFVFSQDAKTLTIRDGAGAFHAWDATVGKHLKVYSREACYSAWPWTAPLGLPRDGRILAALNGLESLSIWDIRANKVVRCFDDDDIWCWSRNSAFSADTRLVATTSRNGDIHVLDIASGKKLHRFRWYAKPQKAGKESEEHPPMFTFSPDGRSLAALCHPGRPPFAENNPSVWLVRVWELATGQERKRFQLDEQGAWSDFKWTADGKTLAISGSDVVLFGVVTGKEVRRFSVPGGLQGDRSVFSTDGKLLAAPDMKGNIYVWETANATRRCELRSPSEKAELLAFSPDGKRLASAGTDATTIVWDIEYFLKRDAPDRNQLEASWHSLADADASKAFEGITLLTAHPRETSALLKERLRPAALPDPKRFEQLLIDLSNPQFAIRQKATHELELLNEVAELGLKKALATATIVELRRRLEDVLGKIAERTPSPGLRQTIRAIEVLEQIGSVEARELLQMLAKGMPGHPATVAAAAALERLAK